MIRRSRRCTVDARGSELISGCYNGRLKFWHLLNGKLLATMRTRCFDMAVIDLLCRRVVRSITAVGKCVNALEFSSDGRWLLTADDTKYIK
ncbi:hypothetical protein KIN20_018624, partial [Parelaphostrongylus tenuis]